MLYKGRPATKKQKMFYIRRRIERVSATLEKLIKELDDLNFQLQELSKEGPTEK